MEKQKTQAFEWFCALRNKITESFLSIEVQSFTQPKIEKESGTDQVEEVVNLQLSLVIFLKKLE